MPIVSININLSLAQTLNLLAGNFLLMKAGEKIILPLNVKAKKIKIIKKNDYKDTAKR